MTTASREARTRQQFAIQNFTADLFKNSNPSIPWTHHDQAQDQRHRNLHLRQHLDTDTSQEDTAARVHTPSMHHIDEDKAEREGTDQTPDSRDTQQGAFLASDFGDRQTEEVQTMSFGGRQQEEVQTSDLGGRTLDFEDRPQEEVQTLDVEDRLQEEVQTSDLGDRPQEEVRMLDFVDRQQDSEEVQTMSF